jgi:hypothetical protein
MATIENSERIEDIRDSELSTKLSDHTSITKTSGSSAENGNILLNTFQTICNLLQQQVKCSEQSQV